MPTILISIAYGPNVTAWYALATQAVYSSLQIISTQMSQVYINEGAKLARNNIFDLKSFYLRSTASLFALALVPMLIVACCGASIFSVVFGAKWFNSGLYAQVLSLMLLIRFAVISASQNLIILKKQGTYLAWNVIFLLLTITAFLPKLSLGYNIPIIDMLMILSFNMVLAYIILFALNLNAVTMHSQNITANQE